MSVDQIIPLFFPQFLYNLLPAFVVHFPSTSLPNEGFAQKAKD